MDNCMMSLYFFIGWVNNSEYKYPGIALFWNRNCAGIGKLSFKYWYLTGWFILDEHNKSNNGVLWVNVKISSIEDNGVEGVLV